LKLTKSKSPARSLRSNAVRRPISRFGFHAGSGGAVRARWSSDSRGAHSRADFEQTDNANRLKNIYLSRNASGPKHGTVPVKFEKLRP
jgi:hypothetical protein